MAVHKWSRHQQDVEALAQTQRRDECEAEQEPSQSDLRALREVAGRRQADVAKLIERTQESSRGWSRAPITGCRRQGSWWRRFRGELEVIATSARSA